MRIKALILIIIIGLVMALTFQNPAFATMTGPCSNCHTMHNSQNGTAMNGSASPNPILLRADCLGCHAKGLSSNIDSTNGAPQVLHSYSKDLAGGNFAYITGAKSCVTADQNTAGHNVIDLGVIDDVLIQPPGAFHSAVSNEELTCAGNNGCHGRRIFGGISGLRSIKGAHHNNTDGKLDNPISDDNIGHHYRFLMGVKGFEDSDWQATVTANDHNEYFGATTPMSFPGACNNSRCHYGPTNIRPSNQTISGFCATCHGNFHSLQGIGGDTSSPFTRHPTDVILPSNGEYSAYTAYSTEAPIARTTVPANSSPTVNPGTDVVMCLSCHAVHATPYADILRWDYSDMRAGDTSASGGCFTCHTQKNQNP